MQHAGSYRLGLSDVPGQVKQKDPAVQPFPYDVGCPVGGAVIHKEEEAGGRTGGEPVHVQPPFLVVARNYEADLFLMIRHMESPGR
jgi:hypothetical protein